MNAPFSGGKFMQATDFNECSMQGQQIRETFSFEIQYTKPMQRSEKYQRFYEVVARIPPGKVATYGQIATLAGFPGQARQVGYALNATPDDLEIPWQRVINAQGKISPRANPIAAEIQRQMLEAEGVQLDARGQVSLSVYRWQPEISAT